MTTDDLPTTHHLSTRQRFGWPVVSLLLLVIYLSFFHTVLLTSPSIWPLLGIAFWAAWIAACHVLRDRFLNRFEYFLHQLVGLDILLEGFSPWHQGYSFYYCAAAFWFILLAYHYALRKKTAPPANVPAKAVSSQSGT